MKKFCALFLCAFMIIAQTIEFIPINAAGAVDYGEMLNIYIGASEAALALSQGAEIDISNFEYPEECTTNKEKAQYLMKYYGALRNVGVKAIYDWLFDPEQNPSGDIISAETAAIGLSSSTGVGPSGIQDLKAQLDNVLATNSNEHIFQRYSNDVIARWNEYNTNYINYYLQNVNYSDSDLPTPSPDPDFVDDINFVNEYGDTYSSFFFGHYSTTGYEGFNTSNNNFKAHALVDNFYNYSYGFESSIILNYNQGDRNTPNAFIFPLSTIEITSSGNTYSFDFHENILRSWVYNNGTIYSWQKCLLFGYQERNRAGLTGFQAWYGSDSYNVSYSGTLQGCFDEIKKYFKNVNITVDGVLWAQAGMNISSGLTVTLPDAVIDSNSDDGKIVAHPIYYPDAIVNDGAIDIDLDKLIDGVAARIGAGDTSISMDDVVADGAAVKLDGTTLTDADTSTADVSVPISAATEGDLTIPLGQVPPLPNLPPIIPPDGMNGNVPDGFAGMSVLARIINVTVQSVPTPIIMAFFGVIFGMIVLGIIKILHH